MLTKPRSELGNRYGILTVISEAESVKMPSGSKRMVLCLCDCGREKLIQLSNLRAGNSKSCGLCIAMINRANAQKKEFSFAARNATYGAYRIHAAKRNLCFELTVEQFEIFTQGDCFYCGAKPSNVYDLNRKSTGKSRLNGAFIYNGIDRLDSNIGYVPNNCVTCCKVCNRAKSDMTIHEFLDWIDHTSKYKEMYVSHPMYHAKSSARKFGGVDIDYLPLHNFFDQTKMICADPRHRLILHNTFGIFLLEQQFGTIYIRPSDGKEVPTRLIGEQHVQEDFGGYIPTLSEIINCIKLEPWMGRNALRLSELLGKDEHEDDVPQGDAGRDPVSGVESGTGMGVDEDGRVGEGTAT